jgi:transcriptional regulator with PAS, ATPase and Fis domain
MASTSDDSGSAFAWLDGIEVAATVCDRAGTCLYMNEHAARSFAKDGGRALVGRSLLDCHPEPARARFAAQLAAPAPNTYTVEKNGVRKLIHQVPWWANGAFAGVIELSFVLPASLPHFVRDPK